MVNVSPGVYTKIVDLSTFVAIVPGTIGFICALTTKGEDNKIKFLSGQNELVGEYGKPNISTYGSNYSQGLYNAYNYLGEAGSLYFMRCLPDDASYSNLRIDGLDYDSSTDIEITYVADINTTTDITTALTSVGIRNPLVIFYPIGRGSYYNGISIELEDDPDLVHGVYILKIYERQSDGDDVIIETFKISFGENAKDINGNSIFVEYILEQYSQILRAKVGTDGFNLLERVFDDEQSPVYLTYEDDIVVTDATTIIDTTAIIDATRVVEVETEQFDTIDGWTTTSSLNVSRGFLSGCGHGGASLCFGGTTDDPVSTTEIWNGTWATTTALTEGKQRLVGCGDTNAALCFGGQTGSDVKVNTTEKWNGSSWVTTTALPEVRYAHAGCGDTSDALCFGGNTGGPVSTSKIWNGSTWATTSSLTTSKYYLAGCGNTVDALCIGGYYSDAVDTTEIWNGSTWATTSTLNEIRYAHAGCGTTSASLTFGGSSTVRTDTTEKWNGSSWATTTALTNVQAQIAGCGSVYEALCMGGSTDSGVYTDITQKWNSGTFAVAVWATTSNMTANRGDAPVLFGDRNGAFLCGGRLAGGGAAQTATIFKWDGLVWSWGSSMNHATDHAGACGSTSNGGLVAAGNDIDGNYKYTDKWTGSAWATTTALNNSRRYDPLIVGTVDDAFLSGGNWDNAANRSTETWDGSTWTTTSLLNTYHGHGACFGDTTCCMACAGVTDGSHNPTNVVEKWNYVDNLIYSWSTTTNMTVAIFGHGGFGTITDALACFGNTGGGFNAKTQIWNGSTWATTTVGNELKYGGGACGVTSDGLSVAGDITGAPYAQGCEKWNGSAWATTTNYTNAVTNLATIGVTGDALSIGGTTSGGVTIDTVYKWNGSAWATTTVILTPKTSLAAVGSTSSGLECGGSTVGGSGYSNIVETWNGSAWSTTSTMSRPRRSHGVSKNVSSINSVLAFGGHRVGLNHTNETEAYNGSAWSTRPVLNTGVSEVGGAGTGATNALSFGGSTGADVDKTEIITSAITPVGSWSTTPSINNVTGFLSAAGTTWNAGLIFGGSTTDTAASSFVDKTETWDGFTWATTSSLNTARFEGSGTGSRNSALSAGGNTSDSGRVDVSEVWSLVYATSYIVEHYDRVVPRQIVEHYSVTTGEEVARITNDGQDFSQWETDPDISPLSRHPYAVVASDPWHNELWGYIGLSQGTTNQIANIYKDKLLTETGWNGTFDSFNQTNPDSTTYMVKRSNEDLTSLFSARPLKKGSDGSLISAGSLDTSVATQVLAQGYSGVIDSDVLDVDSQYFNLVFDAGYPKDVKDQIVGLAQSREDCVAIVDVGDNVDTNSTITARSDNYPYNTYYASLFSPYSKIFDIWTERNVWFSPCYHMSYILPNNDRVGELWFAAAGNNRGVCRGIKELRYTPNRSQRDLLYLDQINPIIHQNNSYMVWGQLTSQAKASAFQDLNIVRLVLYISTALKRFANSFVFEQNDAQTWNLVYNDVVSFLENVKKKRGLFGYSVDVGATDAETRKKKFHINIILEPVKITEKIELNFFIK